MSQSAPSGDILFSDLSLSPKILHVLAGLNFVKPTPIQSKAIPVALTGRDVIGIAQTGTGKTLAFTLPMIQRMARVKKQGLIILPTRELAMQVSETLQKVGGPLGLRTTMLIGGAPLSRQISEIRKNPHVIIGTPGRMIDHLKQKNLSLEKVGILVLDEADRMLDMGFAPQVNEILRHLSPERQTMLFSATMPPEIVKIINNYMNSPVRLEVAPPGRVADGVEQAAFLVSRQQKNSLLENILRKYQGSVLVFSRTKYGAKKICREVNRMGHSAGEVHSNLSLNQRKRSLADFKSGRKRVLVATDIAARGIDVSDIELVVNYDLPDSLDDYVHRVGRTGRAGKKGQAISFITPDQRDKIRTIERLVKRSLPITPLPELASEARTNSKFFAQPVREDRKRVTAGRKSVRIHL